MWSLSGHVTEHLKRKKRKKSNLSKLRRRFECFQGSDWQNVWWILIDTWSVYKYAPVRGRWTFPCRFFRKIFIFWTFCLNWCDMLSISFIHEFIFSTMQYSEDFRSVMAVLVWFRARFSALIGHSFSSLHFRDCRSLKPEWEGAEMTPKYQSARSLNLSKIFRGYWISS